MALPKIEARITVPTGGWDISVQEYGPNAGPVTVNIPAGDYFPNSVAAGGTRSLNAELKYQLDNNATLAGTYSVTTDDTTDAATGQNTISATGVTTFDITWTSTDFRDRTGYAATLTGALTYLAPEQAEYLFLPTCGNADPIYVRERDLTITHAPSGSTKALSYNERRRERLTLVHLIGSRVRTSLETVTNESLQTFWSATVGQGIPIRFHTDRSDDTSTSYDTTWRVEAESAKRFAPQRVTPHADGAKSLWTWSVDLVELV